MITTAANLAIPHASLAEVALIDATACAAVGSMSVSWWHEEVRTGRAPAPVIRQTRCTRWKLADVRDFWVARVEAAASDAGAADLLTARAKKASAAASAKRAAAGGQA
jgi:hypothetical protein